MNKVFLILVGFLLANTALSEAGPLGFGDAGLTQELESDRPDFTEGTQTIDPGHLQLESGYSYLRDEAAGATTEEHTLPEILLRAGLMKDLELRIAWEGYLNSADDSESDSDESGVSDMSVGVKQGVYSGESGGISTILELGIPVGSEEFTADEVEPAVKFLLAKDLNDRLGVAGNLNASSLNGEAERYLEIAASATVGVSLTNTFGTYLEYFGMYPTESVPEEPEHYFNGGVTLLATEDLQFDLRAGLGLNDDAADFFTGAGVVLRK